MGCNQSSVESKVEEKRNKEIERQAVKDKRADEEVIKLLLLGAGESGKSTIFKQMKILYGKDYEKEELEALKPVIYSNINWNMRQVLEAAEPLGISLGCPELVKEYLTDLDDEDPVDAQKGDLVKKIWSDSGVQEVWEHRSDYQVLDSLSYYMESIDRIMQLTYVPDKTDILNARVRTSGVVEERYVIEGVEFLILDVGGQRNERKKWLHCFNKVTAIIFVAAINEYDQKLFEDSETNRVDEAVILFADVCENHVFNGISVILFLNKSDIFRQKLFVHPLRVDGLRHTDFLGPYAGEEGVGEEQAVKAAQEYMTNLFLSAAPDKEVYSHVTCATDTQNIDRVFLACRDIILRANLKGGGFLGTD